jgi:hypothetical protein
MLASAGTSNSSPERFNVTWNALFYGRKIGGGAKHCSWICSFDKPAAPAAAVTALFKA